MNNSIVVKTENLTKSFYSKEIIENFNITVYEGSIYGFLGANGAGKTTVFKMLTGLIAPTVGKAEVLGMNIAMHRNEILRNIGSIVEIPYFYEHMTAVENLKIYLVYMGIGFIKKSVPTTILSAILLSSLFCNVTFYTTSNTTNSLIFMSITVIAGIITTVKLIKNVNNMEV